MSEYVYCTSYKSKLHLCDLLNGCLICIFFSPSDLVLFYRSSFYKFTSLISNITWMFSDYTYIFTTFRKYSHWPLCLPSFFMFRLCKNLLDFRFLKDLDFFHLLGFKFPEKFEFHSIYVSFSDGLGSLIFILVTVFFWYFSSSPLVFCVMEVYSFPIRLST